MTSSIELRSISIRSQQYAMFLGVEALTKMPLVFHPGLSTPFPTGILPSFKTACCSTDRVPHQIPNGLAPVIVTPESSTTIAYASDVHLPATSWNPLLLPTVKNMDSVSTHSPVLMERFRPMVWLQSLANVDANSDRLGGMSVHPS